MDEFKQDLKIVRESQIRMEGDIKYHIKRTDILEEHVNSIQTRVDQLNQPMSFKDIVKIAASIGSFVVAVLVTISYLKK